MMPSRGFHFEYRVHPVSTTLNGAPVVHLADSGDRHQAKLSASLAKFCRLLKEDPSRSVILAKHLGRLFNDE